jgi:integrase/recombinase XerC
MKTLTDEFLRHCRNRYSTETVRHLRWQLGKFCRYFEEQSKDYRMVSKENVESCLLETTQSRQIRRKMLLTISAFYDFVKSHYPENSVTNPCRGLHIGRGKAKGLPVVPSVTEIAGALSQAPTEGGSLHDLRNRAMLELAYGSGLRRSEIVRLNITDIDLVGMTGRVTGKGDKVRIVPLSHAACEAMREYLLERKAARGPLFIAHPKGTRLTPFSLNAIFKKTGGIRPHLYRHACATHMLKNGCDIRIIQELLGHEYLTTTQVYTHITTHDLGSIVNRIHPRSGPIRCDPVPGAMERATGPPAEA